MLHELVDGLGLLQLGVEIRIKHSLKGPLRPVIVFGVAGAHLAVPVEAESNLVELLAIVVDILFGGDGRMLSGLDGILFGRQAVGIVAHRIEHVESILSLIACIDVAGDISERMAHMESGPRGVWEHVQNIVFRAIGVFHNLIGFLLYPSLLPFLFDITEVVFHYSVLCLYSCLKHR